MLYVLVAIEQQNKIYIANKKPALSAGLILLAISLIQYRTSWSLPYRIDE